MMKDHTLLLLGLLCLANFVHVYGISSVIEAHEEQCFFEEVPQGYPVNVMFQVISGGFLDIDLKITAPDGKVIYEGVRETEGNFCFGNRMSTLTPKTVSFIITVGETQTKDVAKKENITPLENQIADLAAGISGVQAEQEYMRIREQSHRNINESTNARVLWWSIFEALVLVAMSAWQVYYLRRFFEVKRVV